MPFSRRSFLQMSGAALLASAKSRFDGRDAPAGLCRKLASDPLRPQYHLLPERNWMNDPNGPIFFGGRYHMFHQYNPQAAVWGNMNWAHATSPDMIHWSQEPIAISPTLGGPDQDGVFSGSAVLDKGKPAMVYTGVAPPSSDAEATLRDGVHTWRETQCLALAQDDDLRIWKKLAEPVIAGPPEGLDVSGFRDPCLWREGDKWMLILGSGVRGKGGMILLYCSSDLRHWTYLHPLVEGSYSGKKTANPVDTGDMWECPDFFPLGDKYVLLISTMGKVHWKVGTYAHQRFSPEKEGIVDWGSYYAAKTMLDRNRNRILWGWIPETRSDAELIAAGWAGVMSLPRVVSLNAENELEMDVLPAVAQLRGVHSTIKKNTLDVRVYDLAAELILNIESKGEPFTLRFQSETGPFATIACGRNNGGREIVVNNLSAPLPDDSGSAVNIHMFLDGSVLEVFANKTVALTARIYQIPSGPIRLRFEGNAVLGTLDVWHITPISKNRLTGSRCS